MKISTRGRYALRLMLDLAQQDPDQYVTIKSIAQRQEVSGKYLEQIITVLSRAGWRSMAPVAGSPGRRPIGSAG